MNNTYEKILNDFNNAFNGNNVQMINIANNITNIISTDTFEPDNNVVISKRGNNTNYYHFNTFKNTMRTMKGKDPFTRKPVNRNKLSIGRVSGGNGTRKMTDREIVERIGGEAEYDDDDNAVVLSFFSNDLSELPKKLFKLTELEYLVLENNNLTSLPKEIGNLTNLETLNIIDNQITSLPKEIGNLTNLMNLDLNSNNLTSLPKEIGYLTNLKTLELNDNNLSSLPKEIGNLTKLKKMDVGENKLATLPKEIGNLTSLRFFDLHSNNLTSLPKEIGNLNKIFSLDLGGNKLSISDVPESLHGVANL